MIIKYDLQTGKNKKTKTVKVDLFDLTEELYKEMDNLEMIDRLKHVKQLGTIRVARKHQKCRYDYVMLQLYLHQLIRKKLQSRLLYTYSNRLRNNDLLPDTVLDNRDIEEVTLGNAIQLLILAYNVGHFYNTFVASKAVVMLADKEERFHNMIVSSIEYDRFQRTADALLNKHNYQRTHLLNSLLLLEKCDKNKRSVRIAKELLYSYLNEEDLPQSSNLRYLFETFRKVRTVGYVTYDLHIAEVPFLLEIGEEKALLTFLDEYLAQYNNNVFADDLMKALAKLLSDAVYNNSAGTICMTQISNKMVRTLRNECVWEGDFYNCWENRESALNRSYPHRRDFDSEILKITFPEEQIGTAEKMFYEIDSMNNTRAGYYLRHTSEYTLAVSLRKRCESKSKTAFRILKTVVGHMRGMNTEPCDDRYILIVKYFLYYLFGERRISISPVTDETKCVITTRGKHNRISELEKLREDGTPDEQHEVEAMISYLKTDRKNDTTIMIPGSTVVFRKDNQTYAEFDGIVIYPNRESEQIVFIEAKNINHTPEKGKKDLVRRLNKLDISYEQKDITIMDYDAYCRVTI